MTAMILALWPNGAALVKRAGRVMDVILHLGAHRTGSTTFQSYMRRSHSELSSSKVGYWGPQRTRQGLFAGIVPSPSGRFPTRDRRGLLGGFGCKWRALHSLACVNCSSAMKT